MSAFNEILDGMPTDVALSYARCTPAASGDREDAPLEVVVVLQFSERGFGFGEITLKQTAEGVFIDTECMSPERVKRYFCELLGKAITDAETDPGRHALYNRVMNSCCGEACAVCFPDAEQKP